MTFRMLPTQPLALHHSWAACDAQAHFSHGLVGATIGYFGPAECWSCDVATNALSWSDGIFDLFGLPRVPALSRHETVRRYEEGSRVVMERLRAHAIRHHRGFTVDVEIRPSACESRWIRLVAMPQVQDGRTIALAGTKQDVSTLYAVR
ncbi:hypothetical protein [Sphingomonas radiodurans]|uniref:hypothetical protein n=1 Tax=Sphingomonas radiodurans TaxID=2890321 RepID=UPI001E4DBAF6|nr:hypothetical protein [Sphingomonas radiodurans]WBH16845.1 hypothetical protein LLW23_01605 [Sphingomonas radiodurans]